jgi:hypothetical protein
MARKVTLVDDYIDDGATVADAGTITFGLEGKNYEIDLSKASATKLRGQFAPWINKARPVGGKRKPPAPATASRLSPDELQARREWAKANGYTVADKGRIAREILDAFENAHKKEAS